MVEKSIVTLLGADESKGGGDFCMILLHHIRTLLVLDTTHDKQFCKEIPLSHPNRFVCVQLIYQT